MFRPLLRRDKYNFYFDEVFFQGFSIYDMLVYYKTIIALLIIECKKKVTNLKVES